MWGVLGEKSVLRVKVEDFFRGLIYHSNLGQLVGLVFAVIVTALSLFYSIALLLNFKWVEMTLSAEHMGDQLHAKVQAIEHGVAPQVNPSVWLYGSHPWTTPVPEQFRSSPLGFSEVGTYFVYHEEKGGIDYYLIKDES